MLIVLTVFLMTDFYLREQIKMLLFYLTPATFYLTFLVLRVLKLTLIEITILDILFFDLNQLAFL